MTAAITLRSSVSGHEKASFPAGLTRFKRSVADRDSNGLSLKISRSSIASPRWNSTQFSTSLQREVYAAAASDSLIFCWYGWSLNMVSCAFWRSPESSLTLFWSFSQSRRDKDSFCSASKVATLAILSSDSRTVGSGEGVGNGFSLFVGSWWSDTGSPVSILCVSSQLSSLWCVSRNLSRGNCIKLRNAKVKWDIYFCWLNSVEFVYSS